VGERPVTPAEDRYAMVEAALAEHPGLEPSRLELERGGPSYTIDTVRELLCRYPGAHLVVVIGSDIVATLPTWKDERDLRGLVTLAVVGRPGVPPLALPAGWRGVDVPVAPLDLSSTELRERLETGAGVDGLIPEAVIRCIRQRGLYATGR
jgi:nicotinate-nucleotide adenylyltransferase